jgi:uncharacterized protein YbjT (DUF2867 family)
MVRDRAKGAELGRQVELVEVDVTLPDTLPAAMAGVSYVLCAIGASTATPPNDPENVDYRGVANLAEAAKAAGVRRFVLMSSIGAGTADPEAPLNRVFGMVLMWKGKGEESLRASGVPYTIVRPGGLADCAAGRSGVDVQPGDARISGRICRGDVALVMIDALTNPAARGKTVAIVGDETAPAGAWKRQWKRIAAD